MDFVTKVWIFLCQRQDLHVKTKGSMEEKFVYICRLIGRMRACGAGTRDMARLKSEFSGGRTAIDNLLYENLGLSGEDVISLLQRGEKMV